MKAVYDKLIPTTPTKDRVLSKNEVAKLKSLLRKLTVLCPELDGLQAKYHIKRVLKGKTREERVEEMLDIVESEMERYIC